MLENGFTDGDTFQAVGKGFMFMEAASPEWLNNLHAKYGDEVVYKIKVADDTLTDIIRSSGNIRKFLAELTNDSFLLENIMPEKYGELGMIDMYTDGFEEYAEVWAVVIKANLAQGINVIRNAAAGGGLNPAVDVDLINHDETGLQYKGDHEINLDELKAKLGPEALMALHAYFHAVPLEEFHNFLEGDALDPDNPFAAIVNASRLYMRYVTPKGSKTKPGFSYGDMDLRNINFN